MKKNNIILFLFVSIILIGFTGCGKMSNVPPGYIGKMLTPTGWQDQIWEAGQVDIGDTDRLGRGNQMIICEATSVTIKESFGKPSATNGNEDHRIIAKDKTPLAVDIYVQVMVPDEKKMRDSIFAQVTPVPIKDEDRTSKITLGQIYEQFARMTIRGKTRQIFSEYEGYMDVMSKYDQVSKRVAGMIAETFRDTKVPLKLVAGQLSNVKADETVWAAENQKAAAQAQVSVISQIGEAMRSNPAYLEKYKWDVLKEIAGRQNLTIIVDGGGRGVSYTLPLKQ